MVKRMELLRSTCDICKKKQDMTYGDAYKKIKKVSIPMKSYDEKGSYMKTIVEELSICEDCMEILEQDISKCYDMKSFAYVGIEIKRKGSSNDKL